MTVASTREAAPPRAPRTGPPGWADGATPSPGGAGGAGPRRARSGARGLAAAWRGSVLGAALILLGAAPASAQRASGQRARVVADDGPAVPSLGDEGCDTLCTLAWIGGALGGAALAVTEVILLADGTIKYGHGHGLYTEGAVLEVILGLAHFAPAAVATWALATEADPDEGFAALGLSSGAFGAYLLIHGVWSLTAGRPPPSHFQIGVAPQPGGAYGTVRVGF